MVLLSESFLRLVGASRFITLVGWKCKGISGRLAVKLEDRMGGDGSAWLQKAR
jgi:hypothetical protein